MVQEEKPTNTKKKRRNEKPNKPRTSSDREVEMRRSRKDETDGSEREPFFDETTGASQGSFEAAKGARPATPPDPGGPPKYRDLTVKPEDLGLRFLQEVTQNPQPELEERNEDPEDELSEEERRREELLPKEELPETQNNDTQ